MKKNSTFTLYCFSPLVMLITFLIEIFLAIAIWWRTKASMAQRLIIFILLCLATFQIAEYAICEDNPTLFWAKLGMVSITMLPALGLHLMCLLTGRPRFMWLGYALAVTYSLAFTFLPSVIHGAECTGNYVVVNMIDKSGFGTYYFAFLFTALGKAGHWLNDIQKPSAKKRAVVWLAIGYLSFILPMAVAYIVLPSIREAVPSVMCGFAVILALILAGGVAPGILHNKK